MLKFNSPVRVLRAAIDMISSPDRWCRYNCYADAEGLKCDAKDAFRSCATGAIFTFSADEALALRIVRMFEADGSEPLSATNDFDGRVAAIRRMRKMVRTIKRERRRRAGVRWSEAVAGEFGR